MTRLRLEKEFPLAGNPDDRHERALPANWTQDEADLSYLLDHMPKPEMLAGIIERHGVEVADALRRHVAIERATPCKVPSTAEILAMLKVISQ